MFTWVVNIKKKRGYDRYFCKLIIFVLLGF